MIHCSGLLKYLNYQILKVGRYEYIKFGKWVYMYIYMIDIELYSHLLHQFIYSALNTLL